MKTLNSSITECEACPRLRAHCARMARIKRRAYQGESYWGKPITGFGDPAAKLLIVGLAPAAHGANRTGRIFTGDRSGDWLFRALYRAGFANQPGSTRRDDGLKLHGAYITCVVKCAPPDNKPNPTELERCSSWLDRELQALDQVRVILALGQIALQGVWPKIAPPEARARPRFGHGLRYSLEGGKNLLLSYHPSQQNTFTGRLTEEMFDWVFSRARELIRGSEA